MWQVAGASGIRRRAGDLTDQPKPVGEPAPTAIGRMPHDQLAVLAREYLLAGHLIDRAGMPLVLADGLDAMRDIAIEEWMGASPVYTKRMQRLLGFDGDTVEASFKGMQLDIGAPPEFMDFRFSVQDDHHGEFHLDHCGALMDVEPMGEDYVIGMCHHIEDPTFDATGWATNPRLRMRPIHRPPRIPADRHPHCAWSVFIDDELEPTPTPERSLRISGTKAGRLPVASIGVSSGDGCDDYSGPLDPDLRMEDFSSSTLRAMLDEIALQGHLLVLSFGSALSDRWDARTAAQTVSKQFTGVAGVVAGRLKRAFYLGDDADSLAFVYDVHPAFRPRSYVDWRVDVDGEEVHLGLGHCPAREESPEESWITTLATGSHRPLQAIATALGPQWEVESAGQTRWKVSRTDVTHPEFDEVVLAKFSTGVEFAFRSEGRRTQLC